MKKVLVINPFGIGDVLFTTAVIASLKESYPDIWVGYWCNQRVSEILRNNPRINKTFALSRGDLKKIYQESRWEGIFRFLKLIRAIKKERFDISLDFSLDHRYSLISKIVGIKKRIGFNYKQRGRFLTDRIDISGYQDKHVVEYYLELLRFLNAKTGPGRLELNIPEADKNKVRRILDCAGINEDNLLVGIVPGAGASWGKESEFKHWPALKFAQLADKIIEAFKAKVLILGDESEKPLADIIVNAMRNNAIDLTGKTSLSELAALVGRLRLLVTNDGGPLHVAVALGVKTVSIFGPVDERVYGPYPKESNHIVIKSNIHCRPCYQNFRLPLCDKDRQCLRSISAEEVFEAVRSLL